MDEIYSNARQVLLYLAASDIKSSLAGSSMAHTGDGLKQADGTVKRYMLSSIDFEGNLVIVQVFEILRLVSPA